MQTQHQSEKQKLKPCPFCKGKADFYKLSIYGKPKGYGVYCESCEIQTNPYSSKQNARKFWNRRKLYET